MLKWVLAILFIFSTSAVIAHGYLAYEYNAVQSLIPEEESHEENPPGKAVKELGKEKINFLQSISGSDQKNAGLVFHFKHIIRFSAGFTDTPFNPPDSLGSCIF